MFSVQLSELGVTYMVVDVLLTDAKYVLPTAKFTKLPAEVALKLKQELNQGKLITIEKDLIDNPKTKDIPFESFTIKEPDDLVMKKSAAKGKVKQRLSAYTALISAYDMFEFFLISSKLNSAGFEIFKEENKEETYLKIIETGDEDLISDLERFLETKDLFERMMKKHRFIKQYFREIDDCDTEEELEEVVKSNKGWLVN